MRHLGLLCPICLCYATFTSRQRHQQICIKQVWPIASSRKIHRNSRDVHFSKVISRSRLQRSAPDMHLFPETQWLSCKTSGILYSIFLRNSLPKWLRAHLKGNQPWNTGVLFTASFTRSHPRFCLSADCLGATAAQICYSLMKRHLLI